MLLEYHPHCTKISDTDHYVTIKMCALAHFWCKSDKFCHFFGLKFWSKKHYFMFMFSKIYDKFCHFWNLVVAKKVTNFTTFLWPKILSKTSLKKFTSQSGIWTGITSIWDLTLSYNLTYKTRALTNCTKQPTQKMVGYFVLLNPI